MNWVTIPTRRGNDASLRRFIRTCGCRVVLVHTHPDSARVPEAVNLEDFGPPNIHRWWNLGLDYIEKQGGTVAAVCNDDLALRDDKQLPRLLSETLRSGATLGTLVHTRAPKPGLQPKLRPRGWYRNLAGWCWVVNLEHGLRPDEAYRWYGGDDELDLQAKFNYAGLFAVRADITHLNEGKPTWPPAFDSLILADWKLLSERWPIAREYVQDLERWGRRKMRNKGAGLSILVPYNAEPPYDRLWAWIERWWRAKLPEAELLVGEGDGSKPFNRSAALNDAFEQSSGETLLLMDSDIWIERVDQMLGEFKILEKPAWMLPYMVHRLDRRSSERLMQLEPAGSWGKFRPRLEAGPYVAKGMVCLIPREGFEAVGGFDERFRGWGDEDIAFRLAVETLYAKPKLAKYATLLHLHHPRPQPRRWVGQTEEHFALREALLAHYRAANGNPEAMEAVLASRESEVLAA